MIWSTTFERVLCSEGALRFKWLQARRALVALKGIVKLQALIRGQNVRKQANMTMKCMQSLLRVQARVRDRRARLSHDAGRHSMFAETTNFLRRINSRVKLHNSTLYIKISIYLPHDKFFGKHSRQRGAA